MDAILWLGARLPKMSRVDAAAFLSTAAAMLAVNAVLAVAIGCSLSIPRAIWARLVRPAQIPDLQEM